LSQFLYFAQNIFRNRKILTNFYFFLILALENKMVHPSGSAQRGKENYFSNLISNIKRPRYKEKFLQD
jgi:hypothetical protein